jgi:hypothetical protein
MRSPSAHTISPTPAASSPRSGMHRSSPEVSPHISPSSSVRDDATRAPARMAIASSSPASVEVAIINVHAQPPSTAAAPRRSARLRQHIDMRSPAPLYAERVTAQPQAPSSDRLQMAREDRQGDDPFAIETLSEAAEAALATETEEAAPGSRTTSSPASSVDGDTEEELQQPPTRPVPVTTPPYKARGPVREIYNASGLAWYIRDIQLLIATLHTRFHVSFRACNLALTALRRILLGLELEGASTLPTSLTTVLSHLQLEDRFIILPSCPVCHKLYGPDSLSTAACERCAVPLFESQPLRRFIARVTRTTPPKPPPVRAVPYAPISMLLADFFAREGMENISKPAPCWTAWRGCQACHAWEGFLCQ